ncbi:hypothetical protein H9Q13_09120 [Pontibacter sp. JH31]|uniref:Aerotolerance regulator N-terminal domain-containing protein n=1 Tax=Pontibacter aquaedesilientis TaxID=2766980 RepID=A0ABR7XGA9_9BACT|nr:hypothetical protein [Pontibacter aquaedesilientis]MBD1397324.1 hypothetical protein [Pontibacter aquaedesilientis]
MATTLPYLLAILSVLLLGWLAWRRPDRRRLAWRLLASAVAGISLVLILFPPTFQRALDPSIAILLTEGYEVDSLDILLDRLEPRPLIYTYQTNSSKAVAIPDLYTFRLENPQVQTVHVLGFGLAEQELQALQNTTLVPHLSRMPAGIASITWPEAITLGEPITVAGQYTQTPDKETTLYLQAFGQARDSITLKETGRHPFQLRYTPKQEGSYTYTLIEKSGNKTDTLGLVPVQVYPAAKPAVLLVSSFPLFEFKFLKNHLGQLQHKVALRSTVSKGMHQREWLNMPHTDLGRISARLLQQFDVVITEPQALQELSSIERTALQRSVTEDGLGVLTIAGEQLGNRTTAFFTNFQSKRLSQQDTRNARARWTNGTTATAIPASPFTLVSSEAVTGLIEEQGNNLLAAGRRAGWGTVALSVVPQTFSWQLEGKQSTYASYWAHLLSSVAKREVQEKFWQLAKPQVPQLHQPATLKLTDYTWREASSVPEATIRHLTDTTQTGIALQQSIFQPEMHEGTFWPRRLGWHVVEAEGVKPFYFLVQDSTAWTHQAIQGKRDATLQFATQQRSPNSKNTTAYTEEQVPVVWFFLLFVLSSGFLWLEEKL